MTEREPAVLSKRATLGLLLLGAVLAASTVCAYQWTTAADTRCNSEVQSSTRVVAMSLSGTSDNFAAADLNCRRNVGAFDAAEQTRNDRSALRRDVVLILLYACLLVTLASLGRRLSVRPVTRTIGRNLVVAVGAAALLDLAENGFLWHAVGNPGRVTQSITGLITAAAVTKLLILAIAAVYGLGSAFKALFHLPRPSRQLAENRPTAAGTDPWARMALVGDEVSPDEMIRQRFLLPIEAEPDSTGVCFSGGGIRSASFALGAIRRLQAEQALWARVRYVSTVSGGGYAAMARQILDHDLRATPPLGYGTAGDHDQHWNWLRENRRYLWSGTTSFLQAMGRLGTRVVANAAILVALAFVIARPIGWISRTWVFVGTAGVAGGRSVHMWQLGAAFLQATAVVLIFWPRLHRWWHRAASTPTRSIGVAAVTITLGATMTWLTLALHGTRATAFIVAAIAIGLVLFLAAVMFSHSRSGKAGYALVIVAVGASKIWVDGGFAAGWRRPVDPGWLNPVLRAGVLLTAAVLLGAVVRVIVTSTSEFRSRFVFVTVLLASTVVVLVSCRHSSDHWAWWVPTGLWVVCLIPCATSWRRLPHSQLPFTGEAVNGARTFVGLAGVIAGVTCLAAILANRDLPDVSLQMTDGTRWLWVVGVVAAAFAMGQRVWSPHMFYRSRLERTFGRGAGATSTTRDLSVCAPPSDRPGPELILCGASYDTDRFSPGDLQAVPFAFTPTYIGSRETGYATVEVMRNALGRHQHDVSLGAAAAISGAAVSPALGATRFAALSQLIGFLNLRLGVWLPAPERARAADAGGSQAPNSWRDRYRPATLLARELGNLYDSEGPFVYVTDGGQLENLGIYELFLRRCKVIYVLDASGDAPPEATSLLESLVLTHRRLGMDFGPSTSSKPVDVGGDTTPRQRKQLWRDAFLSDLCDQPNDSDPRVSTVATATFHAYYPGDPEPATVYFGKARLSMDDQSQDNVPDAPTSPNRATGYLPYADRNRKFPADSTADQFPDLDQFDAYVALGETIADRLIAKAAQ